MQFVPDSHVLSRYSNGFPREVELICPHCLTNASFEADAWQEHGRHVTAADAECSRCEGKVLFVQLLDGNDRAKANGLHVNPPAAGRDAMPGLHHLHALAGPLGRTYETALKLYNRAEWGASALIIRHLLEGLAVRLCSEDKRDLPLSRQLDALQQEVDLTKPLQDVGALLEKNGAFGRHFEDEAAIDQVTAGQFLELAEQLIAYLVVLPSAMTELKSRIATAPVPLRRTGHGGGHGHGTGTG